MAADIFDRLQRVVIKLLKKHVTDQLAYVHNYEKTVQELDNAVKNLRTKEKDVRDKAEEDEDKYGREVHEDVKRWLVRVEKVLSEYEEFKKCEDRECLRCFLIFPNLKARFDNIKTAEDIKETVGELQKRKECNESCCQEGPSSKFCDDAIASSSNANNESCRQCHEATVESISTEYVTSQLPNLCYHEKNVKAEEQDKFDENLRRGKGIIECDTSQQAECQANESRCQGPSFIGDDASSSNANVEAEEKGKVDQNLQDGGEKTSDNSEHKKPRKNMKTVNV